MGSYSKATGACFPCGAMDHAIQNCSQLHNQGNRNQQQRQAALQNQAPAQNQARPPQQQQRQVDNKSKIRMLILHSSNSEMHKGGKIGHINEDEHTISIV